MKRIILIFLILCFDITTARATYNAPHSFEKYVSQLHIVAVVNILRKENIDGCTIATATVIDSVENTGKEISFVVFRDDDFLNETKPYLVFLFKAKKLTNTKCASYENILFAKGIVQSLFPIMSSDFCDLDKICDFLIQRESIFYSKRISEERFIRDHIYGEKRIYANVRIKNLRQIIREIMLKVNK